MVPASLSLQSNATYSGAVTINGGQFIVAQANSGKLESTSFTVNGNSVTGVGSGGSALVIGTNQAAPAGGRINDAAVITLRGGGMVYAGSNTAGVTSETIKEIVVGAGQSLLTVTSGTLTQTELIMTSLTREAKGTIQVRGSNLGGTAGTVNTSRIMVTGTAPSLIGGGGAAGSKTISILPWAVGGSNVNNETNDLITYESLTGLRYLVAAEYATTLTTGANDTQNYSISNTTISSNTTINAFKEAATNGKIAISAGMTLTVTSGVGVFAGGNSGTSGTGTLYFGANEGILYTSGSNSASVTTSIAGSGGLTKAGAGTMVLSAAAGGSTYSGTTTVTGGILKVGATDTLPTGTDVVLANTTTNGLGTPFTAVTTSLDLNGFNQTIGSLAGGGTFGGNVLLGSNTLTTGGGNASTSYGGIISGTGSVSKGGSGVFTVTGSIDSAATVSGGTLKAGSNSALGFGAVHGVTGTAPAVTTVGAGGTLDLNGTSMGEPIILNGTGSGGNGALINSSGTTATLGGIAGVTFTSGGGGYSSAPTISFIGTGNGASAIATMGLTSASVSAISGGGNWTVGDTLYASGGDGSGATFTVSSVSSGVITALTILTPGTGYTIAPNSLAKISSALGNATTTGMSVTFNSSNSTVVGVSMTNPGSGYTGTPTYTFSGNASAGAVTLASMTLASDSSIGGTGNTTIGAVISETGGARSLTKVGSGALTLGGANAYTGNTTVSSGTLILAGGGSISNSPVIQVASGANLNASAVTGGFQLQAGQKLQNKGTFTGSLTAHSGSTYAPGNSPGIATQAGDLALNTGSAFEWELIGNTVGGAGTNFDQTSFTSGGLTIQTGVTANLVFNVGSSVNWNDPFWSINQQWLVFTGAGSLSNVTGIFTAINLTNDNAGNSLASQRASASFNFSNTGSEVYLNYVAVPEPATWALLAGAGAFHMVLRRRRA